MTTTNPLQSNPADIRSRFAELRQAGKRHKDAAESLGLSEGMAIAAHVGAHDQATKATPLRKEWLEILQGVQACGPVLALTRNESTVHEKTGVYNKVSGSAAMGLALDPDIDLRLFFTKWHAGFAVFEPAASAANPPSQSLQFFDAQGIAVHKIFVRDASDRGAFNALVERFADANAAPVQYQAAEPKPVIPADSSIDATALAADWAVMKDTHEFFGLLKKHAVERQQALRLTNGQFTQPLPLNTVRTLLDEAAMDETPIMVFVGSPGCIQIHSGPVRRIEPMATPNAQWINVLDAGFNLHLREDMVANIWAVQKPTSDGIVTSVEVFDHTGELMVMFFGSRKPGTPELQTWRDLVARLPRVAAAATV
jgi:putative hemin transport protein